MVLGEILKYKKGKAPNSQKIGDNYVIYLSPEYLRNKATATLIPDYLGKVEVDENDLLLLWDGSNAGEFFVSKKGILSSTMVKLLFDEEHIDKSFLYYQLKSIEDFLKSQTNGSGIPHVDKEILLSIGINDFNKSEQRKIAAILSKVDKAISQTEKLIAKYSRIKTGLMQDLLTKGIDENGNIRSEETHQFKDSLLGRIPVEWEVDSLGQYSFAIGDGTHSSIRFSENGDIPFLFVSCIKPFKIDWSKKASISINEHSVISKGREVNKGTVLYSLVGSYGNAVTLVDDVKLAFQRHIGFINTDKDRILSQYLTLFLNSSFGKQQADDLAVGNAQKTITLGALRSFLIKKPTIKEQEVIIKSYEFIENQISVFEVSLSKLQSTKNGLMQDLLSGKVQVNHLIKEMASA